MLFWHLILSVLCRCTFWPGVRWHSFAILQFSGRTLPAGSQKHPHPVNVVCQVAQIDFHTGSSYTGRAQQQITRSLGLHTEDVLDPRTNLGPGLVAFLFSWRQWTMTAPLALDMFAKAFFRQSFQPIRRSISRIRPHVLARVFGKDLLKHLAIMLGRGEVMKESVIAATSYLHFHC